MSLQEPNHLQTNKKGRFSIFKKHLFSNRECSQEQKGKIFSGRDRDVEYTDMPTWNYTMMRNSFINNYRLNIDQDLAFTNSLEIYLPDQINEGINGNSRSAYSAQKINHALESMDDYFRVSFKMYMDGYRYEEIAEKLNLKVSSVKCRISYTCKRIFELIKDLTM